MIRPRVTVVAGAAVAVVLGATAGSASADCEARVTFQNPYTRPVVVDLRESTVASRVAVNSGVEVYGTRRVLGTVPLRVNGRSRVTRSFRLTLGCGRTPPPRRWRWVVRHLGVDHLGVRRVGASTFDQSVRLAGMPTPPPIAPPVVLGGEIRVPQGQAAPVTFRWSGEVGASFEWQLYRPTVGEEVFRAGVTRARSADVLLGDLRGGFAFRVRQTDGSGLLRSRYSAPGSLIVEATGVTP